MKVGDYVRTEDGIDKIIGYRYEAEYENGHVLWFEKSDSGGRFTDKDLPKSSPNIIDLIEVGDYINKQRVCHIEYDEDDNLQYIFTGNNYQYALNEDDIKSIVTKEMFANAEYRVETN